MSLYRSQSSPQGAKRFRMNSSYHDATYSRDHRSFRYVWTVLMVNLEEEDYEGDIYKIVGNGYAACIITEFLRCLATLHSGHIAAGCHSDTVCWNCKEPGHHASHSPNDPVCHACGKMGHLARECCDSDFPVQNASLGNN
ncbi:hypothetical protein D5086_020696 [Populus alba]|uniref:Uncharacterized protein n=1 Tax=Populus alba TaxID=43335 RepID=A0ACC4BKT3_POPAL